MITYHVSISWSSLDCLRDTLHKIIYENMSKFIGEIDIQQNRKKRVFMYVGSVPRQGYNGRVWE